MKAFPGRRARRWLAAPPEVNELKVAPARIMPNLNDDWSIFSPPRMFELILWINLSDICCEQKGTTSFSNRQYFWLYIHTQMRTMVLGHIDLHWAINFWGFYVGQYSSTMVRIWGCWYIDVCMYVRMCAHAANYGDPLPFMGKPTGDFLVGRCRGGLAAAEVNPALPWGWERLDGTMVKSEIIPHVPYVWRRFCWWVIVIYPWLYKLLRWLYKWISLQRMGWVYAWFKGHPDLNTSNSLDQLCHDLVATSERWVAA